MTTQELAHLIYDAFKDQENMNPGNFVGEYGNSFHDTHLDGEFDLHGVAMAVLAKLDITRV